jgi:hypothetical protein
MSDTKKIVDAAVPVAQKAAEAAPALMDSGMSAAIDVIDTASKNKRGILVAGVTALALVTVGTGAYLLMKRRAAKNVDEVADVEVTETEKVVVDKKTTNEKR